MQSNNTTSPQQISKFLEKHGLVLPDGCLVGRFRLQGIEDGHRHGPQRCGWGSSVRTVRIEGNFGVRDFSFFWYSMKTYTIKGISTLLGGVIGDNWSVRANSVNNLEWFGIHTIGDAYCKISD